MRVRTFSPKELREVLRIPEWERVTLRGRQTVTNDPVWDAFKAGEYIEAFEMFGGRVVVRISNQEWFEAKLDFSKVVANGDRDKARR